MMNGPEKFNSLPARSKPSESVTSFNTVSSDLSDVEYNVATLSLCGSNQLGPQPSRSDHGLSALSLEEPRERNRLQSAPSNYSVFEERDGRVDEAWNPRASVAFNNAIGLLNPRGSNNCFLNSAIQVLWHLDTFRRNFRLLSGHWCLQNSCIFCALKVIFTQFQFSEHQALPPDALRLALAKSFADQHRFQLGQMDDAAECFEIILGRIHFHLTRDAQEDAQEESCQIAHCLPHQKFAMFIVEQLVCECGATSEPFLFNQIVYYVSTTAVESCLHAYKVSGRASDSVSFGVLLLDAKNFGENRPCPSSCGKIAETRQALANTPEVFTIGFSWHSDQPGPSHIRKIVKAISVDLRPSELVYSVADDNWGKMTVAKLVGLVCYQGKHYSTFIFHSKLKTWVLFDDDLVREIGPEWNELVKLCIMGNYQPLLLLYSDPRGVPIDTSTAPVNSVSVCNEALNASGIQRHSRNDADSKTELRSNQSQAKSDRDSAVFSRLEHKESRDFDRGIEGVKSAEFRAMTEIVPHNRNSSDKLSQSSRKSGKGEIGDSRTVKCSGNRNAHKSSMSLGAEDKSGRLSCRESEFESDGYVDSDAASETQFQNENHGHADQTGYVSNRDHAASCPDGFCAADRNKDTQTFVDKTILAARNLPGLAVHLPSQDAADSSSERSTMVGKENLRQRHFVAENKRNAGEEKVFGTASGKTRPAFNTTDGRKFVGEDRFSSVKPQIDRHGFTRAPEASEKYTSNITFRQNRFSSVSVSNPLYADHSICPSTDSSLLSTAFSVGSEELIGHRTLPNRTVISRTIPTSFGFNPSSTDSFAYRTQNSSDRQNSSVALNSAAFLPSQKVERRNEGKGENYGRAGENFDPARKPFNAWTSRKIEYKNYCRDDEDPTVWNFSNHNRNRFDKSSDVTGDSDLFLNPIGDYGQVDCSSPDHFRQIVGESMKFLRQSDEFVELSRTELEIGNVLAATDHCNDASHLLKMVRQYCHLDGSIELQFQLSLRKLKDIMQEIGSWYVSREESQLNCQTEHSDGDVDSTEKSHQQEILLTVKNSRAEWDENMNKNSNALPGSDRGPVFYLSGHRKLDQSDDLKTGDCRLCKGTANGGISSQSRENALGSRCHSPPTVYRTCDKDLAQKIINAPCHSFPGVSLRCSSTSDQCSINRNQNSNKVSAPVFSATSSLPRHRNMSSSHSSLLSICRTRTTRCEEPREASRNSQLTTLRLQGREHERKPWK